MADVLSKSGPHLLEPDRWQIECHPVRWHDVQKAYIPCAFLDARFSISVKPASAAVRAAGSAMPVVTASRSERQSG